MPEVYYEISALLGSLIDVMRVSIIVPTFGVCLGALFSFAPDLPDGVRKPGYITLAISAPVFILMAFSTLTMSLAWKNMPLIYRILEGS